MTSREVMPLTPYEQLVMGYGFARYHIPQRSFTLAELALATTESDDPVDVTDLAEPANYLVKGGYLGGDGEQISRNLQVARLIFQEQGLEPLMTSVLYGVRNQQATLPGILKVQISVDALIDYADFFGQLETLLLEPVEAVTDKVHPSVPHLQIPAGMAEAPAV